MLSLLAVASLSASAQSYDELWTEAAKERSFKPQSFIETMEKIKAKAEGEGNMPQLLKADFELATCRVSLTAEALDDVLEHMKKEELKWRTKDAVASAFYCVFLHNSIDGDTVYSRQALSAPDLLASKRAADFQPLVSILRESDAVSASDDLLYLIGTSVGESRFLNEYYTRKGNRRAALLTAFDIFDKQHSASPLPLPKLALKNKPGNSHHKASLHTLDSLQNLYGDLDAAAEIDIRRCFSMLNDETCSAKETYDAIVEAINRRADYPRTDVLRNILLAVTAPSVDCRLDKSLFSSRDSVVLNVEYSNVKEVRMTLYRVADSLNIRSLADGYAFDKADKGDVFAEKVFTLPVLEPYRKGNTTLRMPPLPLGGYVLEARADTLDAGEMPLRVSDLRLITMSYPRGMARLMAVDAISGKPLPGVCLMNLKGDKPATVAVTGSDGEAKVASEGLAKLLPQTDADRWSTPASFHDFLVTERDTEPRLLLLTDRQIYRPGQEVSFKALLYRNFGDNDATAIKGEKVIFIVEDSGGNEIFTAKGRTDAYGCCNMKFTIPKSAATGEYEIYAETEDVDESKTFSVEEYKRPTFSISLNSPTEPYVLGDTIRLSGKAETLMHSAVQDATVVLEVDCSGGSNDLDAWAKDTTITVVTDAEGHYDAVLSPDLYGFEMCGNSLIEIDVTAKVTDRAGETHSLEYYRMTLSEKPVTVQSSYFYKEMYERKNLGDIKLWTVNGNNIIQSLPITYWFEGYEKYSVTKQGDGKVSVEIPDGVPNGRYRLYATCMGDTLEREVTVFDIADKRPCYDTRSWFYATNNVLDPTGKTPVTIQVGTGDAGVSVAYAVFSGNKVLEEGRFEMTDSIVSRDIYYKEQYGDGLLVAVAWYRDGQLYENNFWLRKGRADRSLRMSWDTFRDRLQPGLSEQWVLNITKPDGTAARADVFATMYDAALDMIEYNRWQGYLEYNSPNMPNLWVFSSNTLFGTYSYSRSSRINLLPEKMLHAEIMAVGSVRPFVCGTVVDGSGDPIAGAMVMSVDGKTGAVTDGYGFFKIDVPVGTVINVSYIGCTTWTGQGASDRMLIRLEDSDLVLEEVVVSGFDSREGQPLAKKALTVQYEQVFDAKDSKRNMVADSVISALYGAVACVDIRYIVALERPASEAGKSAAADFSGVPVRENLTELAFCHPDLRTDDRGNVKIVFTVPESLTEWQLRMFAHTKDLYVGNVEGRVVTDKEFMVQPNMPRFLRVGDEAQLSARVLNTSDRSVKGTARLVLIDPETEREVYTEDIAFDVAAKQTAIAAFHYAPKADHPTLLVCRMIATDGISSDGEQHYLPLLSRRELVMRTLPFTMYGSGKKTIDIRSLLPRSSLNAQLTIEHTSNPAMLMLQSVHAYAEPLDDCILCQGGALFVNSFGHRLVTENPALADSLAAWNKVGGEANAHGGNLQRNEQLLNIVMQETPWAMVAKNDAEQKQRLADFLNVKSLKKKIREGISRMKEMQHEDGSWGWFPGMNGSEIITLLTLESIVEAQEVGTAGFADDMRGMQKKAFAYLASAMEEHVKALKQKDRKVLSRSMLEYLYLCAKAKPELTPRQSDDRDYLISLLDDCFRNGSIYDRALCAIIFHAGGRDSLARDYAESVKQFSIYDPERGRYFDTEKALYSWRSYKIPTQTKAIEALAMITPDDRTTIDEMQRWLLQEKRTQQWKSSVAAVDAVNAFMAGRENAFAIGGVPAEITVDEAPLARGSVTRAEGYVKATMPAEGKRQVVITKPSGETSWGAVYVQATCDVDDVKSSGSDITVKREIMKDGKPASQLRLGDRVTVRITVSAVRDFDFVQVSDRRPACLEPVVQTGGYDYSQRCYVSSRDTRTDYFIAQMPRGEWVIEKDFYVDRLGTYHSGTVTAQCAYSPEYTATGKAVTVVVDE